jgi:predicted nucleic acid-binding protein
MDATNAFVLDGSITMVWGFEDESDAYAEAILDKMPELQAHVPSLWPLEVANALLVGERRNRIKPADAARFLTILGAFPIIVDDQTVAHAWGDTMHLARAHNLSSYDASWGRSDRAPRPHRPRSARIRRGGIANPVRIACRWQWPGCSARP